MLSFSLGPLGVSTELAIVYVALFMAWLVGWLVSRKRGVNPEAALFNIVFMSLLAARIGFVTLYFNDYKDQLWQVIDIRDGGFIPVIGLLMAWVMVSFYMVRQPKLRYGLGMGLAAGLVIGLIGLAAVSGFKKTLQMPSVVLTDMQGNEVTLADFKGKPVVVNLWATWCPPCRREMPALQNAQQTNQDVQFVFVNQGEDSAEIAHYLQQQQLQLDNVILDLGTEVGQAVSSRALPTTLFYDAEGNLVNSHLGELSKASLKHALRRFDKEVDVK